MNLESVKMLDELLAYPNLHYRTLCTRATILRFAGAGPPRRMRDAMDAEAIGHLTKAIALTETPREMAVGGDLARAEFFAHYTDAFEQLVELYVAQDVVRRTVCRGESQKPHVPRPGPANRRGYLGVSSRQKSPSCTRSYRKILADHHEISQVVRSQSDPDLALLGQLADIRQKYLELEVRIRRALVTGQALAELKSGEEIHRALVKPDNVVLYYYVTRKSDASFRARSPDGYSALPLAAGQ